MPHLSHHKTRFGTLFASGLTALCACAIVSPARAQSTPPDTSNATGTFTLDPTVAWTSKLPYFPIQVALSTKKPDGITKEPTYRGTPKYATIHVGNGPNSAYFIAVDEPAMGDYKIYFDKNRNGDLTDDGDGAWSKKKDSNGRTMYGLNEYVVKASWGAPESETSSGDYGLAFYRFVGMDYLLMFREAARKGTVTVDGKSHPALLVENDADGIYSKPLDDNGKPVGGGAETRPVWMMIDMDNNGKMGTPIDVRSPFKLGNKNYEAQITPDGSSVKIVPTTRKVPEKPKEPEAPPLLKAGTMAPNFTAEAWGGGMAHLADFKGKVVVLDFWATWCHPCQESMPHIERVYQAVKNKGVVVLGVCVWDEKAAYEKWIPEHKGKYNFKFAFDPAGRDSSKSIAGKLFQVSGIPTTYIIGKDGKVVDAVVGYENGDTRVEEALKKAGVMVPVEKKSSEKKTTAK